MSAREEFLAELRAASNGDRAGRDWLYSDAMDSAATAYSVQGYVMRDERGDGETIMRRQLAAAFRAFLENTPESDLTRLARPPAPHGIGASPADEAVAEGPQAVARTPSKDAKEPEVDADNLTRIRNTPFGLLTEDEINLLDERGQAWARQARAKMKAERECPGHEAISEGTREQSLRGWHPAHCKHCGKDMSIDSGD